MTVRSAPSEPTPSKIVIFFDFMKPVRPLTRPSTTFCLRAWAEAKSTVGCAGLDAELGGVGDVAVHRRRLEERLGRDAATVEAGAAHLVLLDDGDVEAGGRGVERGAVSAGAAADHHEIEVGPVSWASDMSAPVVEARSGPCVVHGSGRASRATECQVVVGCLLGRRSAGQPTRVQRSWSSARSNSSSRVEPLRSALSNVNGALRSAVV